MATSHGSKASLKLGTAAAPTVVVDVSTLINNTAQPQTRDKGDVTTFHALHKKYVMGPADGVIPVEAPFEPTLDEQLWDLAAYDGDVTYEYYPQGEGAGKVVYTGTMSVEKYDSTSDMGGAATCSASLQIQSKPVRTLDA